MINYNIQAVPYRLMTDNDPKVSGKFQKYFELSHPLTESSKQSKATNSIASATMQGPKNKDAMDLKTVVNTFEDSRVSHLDRPTFNLLPNRQKPVPKNRHPVKAVSFEVDEDFEEKVYSPINRLSNNNTEKEEFLPDYQNRGLKSIFLFGLFVVLILLEMVVTVLSFRENQQNGTSMVSIAFIILCSEAIYELLVKYVLKIEIKSLSVRERIHRLNAIRENWTKKIMKRENLVSLGLVLLITAAYFCYFQVLTQHCLILGEAEGEGYLICDLFWANILMPILLEKFYFMKSFQSKRGKFTLFITLLVVMAVLILASNWVLFALFVIRTVITLIKFKSQHDLSWISDVSSFLLIIGVLLLLFARRLLGVTNEDFTFLQLVLTAAKYIVFITLAMLVTRCITRVYLEKRLFEKLYNEAHINLAFILSALLVTLPSLSLALPASFARLAVDLAMLWIVYLDGAESFEITLAGKTDSDYGSL